MLGSRGRAKQTCEIDLDRLREALDGLPSATVNGILSAVGVELRSVRVLHPAAIVVRRNAKRGQPELRQIAR